MENIYHQTPRDNADNLTENPGNHIHVENEEDRISRVDQIVARELNKKKRQEKLSKKVKLIRFFEDQ